MIDIGLASLVRYAVVPAPLRCDPAVVAARVLYLGEVAHAGEPGSS